MKRSYKLLLILVIVMSLACAVPTAASAKLSKNTYAKKITSTGGKLSPGFSKTRKTYTVTSAATTTKVTIKATKAQSGAKIYMKTTGKSYRALSSYAVKLKPGKSTYVYIKIKAQNRKYSRTYRVKVTRKATSSTAGKAPDTTTVSQKNAIAKAKSYLSWTSFSRDGLVDQLVYEKFSYADAVYGADHCGANWNDQAVKSAKSYLSWTSFSRDGLIDQLVYEEFSYADAVYGADHCGANWNDQAAKSAKSYLSWTSFSRDGLIDQLLYEKFTQGQAEYGVNAVGL